MCESHFHYYYYCYSNKLRLCGIMVVRKLSRIYVVFTREKTHTCKCKRWCVRVATTRIHKKRLCAYTLFTCSFFWFGPFFLIRVLICQFKMTDLENLYHIILVVCARVRVYRSFFRSFPSPHSFHCLRCHRCLCWCFICRMGFSVHLHNTNEPFYT